MKIKVEILPGISTFLYGNKTYEPGDVLEVEEEHFVSYLMKKTEELQPIEETLPSTETEAPEETETPKTTKRTRKRATSHV